MQGTQSYTQITTETLMPISLTQYRVSVVIPTYNCARYLPEAVESVLNQNDGEIEIVVIDDGSTDQTQAILQPYRNSLRYIYQKNQGVAIARNRGIELAQAPFVAFLDADDYYLPGKLAAQLAVFTAQPELGIVHSGWYRVNERGQILAEVRPWERVPNLNLETWLFWKPVLPSAMMFRRQWLERVGGFNPRFTPAEDTELVLRLALNGCQADWLRQVTTCYRQHEQSVMRQGLPQASSLAAVLDHFFNQPNLPARIRLREKQVRYSTLVWIAWYLHYTGHPSEMVRYLQQAWYYQPYFPTETLVNWIESFVNYSRNWGENLDVELLSQFPSWQHLIQWLIAQGDREKL